MTFPTAPSDDSAQHFNSHPHEEDDTGCPVNEGVSSLNFNSHPHEEDDGRNAGFRKKYRISTHILTKRMTILRLSDLQMVCISTHILTKRMTCKRSEANFRKQSISTHILTKRMTVSSRLCAFPFYYFNSHPHEEDDGVGYRRIIMLDDISTHILTKRMTKYLTDVMRGKIISTHILTKRMTDGIRVVTTMLNISTHILTKRMTAQLLQEDMKVQNFNSHPHEEDDGIRTVHSNINREFQLTSSRRG